MFYISAGTWNVHGPACRQTLCWDVRERTPRFFSQKRRNSKCKTSCQIIRTANPGRSSTRGMILGIWNSVRGARWNQIKTKLPSVRLQARNPRLSMNFDRYKGNKRRKNREGVVLYFRWALLLWAAREQNGKHIFIEKGSGTKLKISMILPAWRKPFPIGSDCGPHKLISTCSTYWIIYYDCCCQII